MPVCELCGGKPPLFNAIVESSAIKVCASCGRFGTVIRASAPKPVLKQANQPVETIVSDFARLVREARARMNLTQKEFAGFLNEKESIVQKIESGSFFPPISVAKKFEKFLKIKLVAIEEDFSVEKAKSSAGGFTIGDFVKSR